MGKTKSFWFSIFARINFIPNGLKLQALIHNDDAEKADVLSKSFL